MTTLTAALLTEGTYPLEGGGVSVWCDQLLRGLRDVDYHVSALGGPDSRVTLPTAPNVRSLSVVRLWTPPARASLSRSQWREFEEPFGVLVRSLVSGQPEAQANADFTRALGRLAVFAVSGALESALADPRSARLLLSVWQGVPDAPDLSALTSPASPEVPAPDPAGEQPPLPRPCLRDALDATLWLTNLLRPLGYPVEGVGLTHAVSGGLSVLQAIATKELYGTPFVLTEHGIYLRERYLSPPNAYLSPLARLFLLRFFRHLTLAAYRLADVLAPASQYNARWQKRLGADPARIEAIHNGIDPVDFLPLPEETGAPTVSWVGRVDPLKDIGTLLRAHALTRRHLPGARLRLFGPVPRGNEAYAQSCHSLIQELGLSGEATFEGRVPAVQDAYRAGQVMALSSISEGFPYTVLEAMASGRPVVATDVGGVREAVGDTGLVVPARDPQAFAAACDELLRDGPRRRRLGREARERVLSLFTVRRCNDAYLKLYHRVASHAAPPSAPVPATPVPATPPAAPNAAGA